MQVTRKNPPVIIRAADLSAILPGDELTHSLLEDYSDNLYVVVWPDHVPLPRYNGDCTWWPLDTNNLDEALAEYPEAEVYEGNY